MKPARNYKSEDGKRLAPMAGGHGSGEAVGRPWIMRSGRSGEDGGVDGRGHRDEPVVSAPKIFLARKTMEICIVSPDFLPDFHHLPNP